MLKTPVYVPWIVLWLAVSAAAQLPEISELQKQGRLPEWANYVCYQDTKKLESSWFVIVAYQSRAEFEHDLFFNGASAFGYKRGLTYQEYLGSDTDIVAINGPTSPETYESELKLAAEEKPEHKLVSGGTADLLSQHLTALRNEIALVKAARKAVQQYPDFERELLKDEEALALLDAPDGTNYHNFVNKHPDFPDSLLYKQKYYNAGITTPEEKFFQVYREGRVVFERDFGSEIFETQTHGEKVIGSRIHMQETSSGLRFLMTYSVAYSGACE